jgi:hypothetical protein
VPVKLVFFAGAVAAAIVSAVLAGLIVAVVGLSARMPAAALVTLIAEAAAAAFGGVIALSGMAASLFFCTAEPGAVPALPGHHDMAGLAHLGGLGERRDYALGDGELRSALRACAELGRQTRSRRARQRALSFMRWRVITRCITQNQCRTSPECRIGPPAPRRCCS